MRDERLRIYLNDHLAGSAAAKALAQRSLRENQGSSFGELLDRFLGELELERGVMLELLAAIGGRENEIKQVAGWLLEKLGRLKLNGQLVGYSELSRIVEIEGLQAGISAKRLLWLLLDELSERDARLRRADFQALAERAGRQLEGFERERRSAAQQAFVSL